MSGAKASDVDSESLRDPQRVVRALFSLVEQVRKIGRCSSAYPGRGDRLAGRDGFTLLEVLVAFSVMAVLLGVLFRGVVMIRASSNAFDDRTHIALIARAVLEDALAARTLPNGRSSGTREGRDWTLVAKPVDLSAQLPKPPPDPLLAGTPGSQARPKWAPQRLVVSVETGGRPLEIETIRLVRVK